MEKEITIIKEGSNEKDLMLLSENNSENSINLEDEKTGGGTSDYGSLFNKPKINGVELNGDKTLEDLGIKQEYTASDITFEDGSTFQKKYNSGELNGKDGVDGKDGINGKDGYTPIKGKDYFDGKDGTNGTNGKDGYTPVKGKDYFDGKDGVDGYTPVKGKDYFDGKDGKDGTNGIDGETPVKGVDYYTEEDKQEMVQLVLASLPNSEDVNY